MASIDQRLATKKIIINRNVFQNIIKYINRLIKKCYFLSVFGAAENYPGAAQELPRGLFPQPSTTTAAETTTTTTGGALTFDVCLVANVAESF